MNNGWIKLFRKIRQWRYWPSVLGEKFSKAEAFIDMLLLANHDSNKVGGVIIGRGQFMTSQEKLAKQWRWSRNKVRRYFDELTHGGEIRTTSNNQHTIVTICNWDAYQGRHSPPLVEMAQQTGQQTEHKQEEKNKSDTAAGGLVDPFWSDNAAIRREFIKRKQMQSGDGAAQ